jgi:hypothetical protein
MLRVAYYSVNYTLLVMLEVEVIVLADVGT